MKSDNVRTVPIKAITKSYLPTIRKVGFPENNLKTYSTDKNVILFISKHLKVTIISFINDRKQLLSSSTHNTRLPAR